VIAASVAGLLKRRSTAPSTRTTFAARRQIASKNLMLNAPPSSKPAPPLPFVADHEQTAGTATSPPRRQSGDPLSDASEKFRAPRVSEDLSSQGPAEVVAANADSTREVLAAVLDVVAPLWPLQDYVAVNPFLGLASKPFLQARQYLRTIRDCELLPSAAASAEVVRTGAVSPEGLRNAFAFCQAELPEWYDGYSPDELIDAVYSAAAASEAAEAATANVHDESAGPNEWADAVNPERAYRTVADLADGALGTEWGRQIVGEITKHCAAHYDQGEAFWPSPWSHLSLFEAFQAAGVVDRRMERLGLTGFRDLVADMPASPVETIAACCRELSIDPAHQPGFLLSEAFSVAGWAAFVQKRPTDAAPETQDAADLVGLLAIRLVFDVALARSLGDGRIDLSELVPAECESEASPGPAVLGRYLVQCACENAYRDTLTGALSAGQRSDDAALPTRPTAQMAFCIDVRSEVIRRHLESASDDAIQTFGFAGFFGMAIEHVCGDSDVGSSHCPVLLTPAMRVNDTTDESRRRAAAKRPWAAGWKAFRKSAASSFTFVESLGLTYAYQLGAGIAGSLGGGAAKRSADGPSPHLSEPIPVDAGAGGLSVQQKIDLAHGFLTNLGLLSNFGRFVICCGHEAQTTNNPYQSGLDCGACGGHSGAPNARIAASLLRDSTIRDGLRKRGVDIPDDTVFLGAVHNTTTDRISLFDADLVPSSHSVELAELRDHLKAAQRLTVAERSERLGGAGRANTDRRAADWAELRPEWGLAGNAAFVVAPRRRTKHANLGGRVFLHDYDWALDPENAVLELILTAPMVVTNWINLQYFASAVDNAAFGSGNKAIHNVVGQFGILRGNGGDLATGLPWQCVHDGERLQHEPLRLAVFVEAPRHRIDRVLAAHANVRELVENGWLSLTAIEEDRFFGRSAGGTWVERRPTPGFQAGPATDSPSQS